MRSGMEVLEMINVRLTVCGILGLFVLPVRAWSDLGCAQQLRPGDGLDSIPPAAVIVAESRVLKFVLSSDGSQAAVAQGRRDVEVWTVGSRPVRSVSIASTDDATALAFIDDGRLLAVGTRRG